MTKAIALCIQLAFEEWNVKRIEIQCLFYFGKKEKGELDMKDKKK